MSKTSHRNSQKKCKVVFAWAVLDVGGKIRHPSASIFDTHKDAKKEADALNALPPPTGVKDPKNYIVKCKITFKPPII